MDIIDISPRESSGSLIASRYDFQKDLAICILLESHEKNSDYLILFDFHDDLMILNSETTPSKYEFLQIKAKESGSWQLSALAKQKEGKDGKRLNSILGKMYHNYDSFKDKFLSATFISNCTLSIKYTDQGKVKYKSIDSSCFNDLGKTNLESIEQKLKIEFEDIGFDSDFLSKAFFKVTALSVKESSTHTKGRISEFLEKRAKGKKYNIELVYKSIFDEVRIKNNYSKSITTFEELKEKKGIGKSYFDEILSLVGLRKDYEKLWMEVANNLVACSVPFGNILKYKSLWQEIELSSMNPTNVTLRQSIKEIKHAIDKINSHSGFLGLNLMDSANLVLSKIDSTKYPFDKDYLRTITLAQLHE